MKLYSGKPREPVHISRAVNPNEVHKTVRRNWQTIMAQLGYESNRSICKTYGLSEASLCNTMHRIINWETWKFHERFAKNMGISLTWLLTHQPKQPSSNMMLSKKYVDIAKSITIEEMKANVASHVLLLRWELGMSQEQICYLIVGKNTRSKNMKNPSNTVALWETGVTLPKVFSIMALARAEDIPIEELLYTKIELKDGHMRWAK